MLKRENAGHSTDRHWKNYEVLKVSLRKRFFTDLPGAGKSVDVFDHHGTGAPAPITYSGRTKTGIICF